MWEPTALSHRGLIMAQRVELVLELISTKKKEKFLKHRQEIIFRTFPQILVCEEKATMTVGLSFLPALNAYDGCQPTCTNAAL